MSEQERILQLEKQVTELKEVVNNSDSRMREIFQEEMQKEVSTAMAHIA